MDTMDTLGTVRAWAHHVERCCANALHLVEPHMDDREKVDKKSLTIVKFHSTPLNTSQQGVQMRSTC